MRSHLTVIEGEVLLVFTWRLEESHEGVTSGVRVSSSKLRFCVELFPMYLAEKG